MKVEDVVGPKITLKWKVFDKVGALSQVVRTRMNQLWILLSANRARTPTFPAVAMASIPKMDLKHSSYHVGTRTGEVAMASIPKMDLKPVRVPIGVSKRHVVAMASIPKMDLKPRVAGASLPRPGGCNGLDSKDGFETFRPESAHRASESIAMASIPEMDLKGDWPVVLSSQFDKVAKGSIPALELIGANPCRRSRGDILQSLLKGTVFP